MDFDLPKEQSSIIKVFGVGGGGGNAVNHMYRQGIKGVDFIICNTDQQALDISPVPTRIQLGSSLTDGRGAGAMAEVGKNAAIEDIDTIKEILNNNTKMVFVTAGMGGGTGTGAAPVIAQAAKEMGILTVGIVTMPFMFEGKRRKTQATDGIENMRKSVDTLLIINNEKLREIYGNLSLRTAFEEADNVLTTAAKGIAEVITVTGQINVDFEDVKTVMTNSGVAIMGSATASGDNRSMQAVEEALLSPLLNDNNIEGANYVLLNITYGNEEIMMDEIADITDYIQDAAGNTAEIIWGHAYDETLEDKICVTVIATGFKNNPDTGEIREVQKKVMNLEEDTIAAATTPAPEQAPQKPINEIQEPYIVQKEEPKEEEPIAPQQSAFTFEAPKVEPTPTPVPQPAANVEPPVVNNTPPQETPSFSQPVNETPSTPVESNNSEDSWEPYLKSDGDSVSRDTIPAMENNAPVPTPEPTPQNDEPYMMPPSNPQVSNFKAENRMSQLKDLSSRLRTPNGITDMENEPAYKRRQVQLDDVPHSSESQVSRFTLGEEESEDGESKTRLGSGNSFLHDNVD